MDAPTLIDDTGPRHRVETWMARVLTLACPLLYWAMFTDRDLHVLGFPLVLTIVTVTIVMSWIEQRRAKDHPKRYRRGLAWTLAVFGCFHLAIVGGGYVYATLFPPTISLVGNTDGGTIPHLPDSPPAISECRF